VSQFFLNPWALALAGLAGGIVLLYILKLRRTKVTVGSTLLWEQSIRDYKANAPWQKLRKNLLLYLQVLALILLALALARPFIFGTALAGGRTILIIDASASMLATDESPDRLGKAIAAATQAVNDFSGGQEGMVIAAGAQPHILQGFSKEKAALAAALKKVRPLAGGVADIDAALSLVSSIAGGSKGRSRVVIFSDGAVPNLDPFAATDLKISFYPVGQNSGNVGIVAAGARREPLGDTYQLFAAVHNFFPFPREADLSVLIGEDTVDVRTLELSPGERAVVNLAGLRYTPQPVQLKLELAEGGDLLPADDVAWLTLPLQRRFEVGLCRSGQSVLLERVLGGMKDVTVHAYEGGTTALPETHTDVWIVEEDAPAPADPGASYLFINSSKHPYLPVEAGEVVKTDFAADPPVIPTIVGVDASHPVLRFVKISDVRLSAVRRVKLRPWARALVDSSEGPLIVEGDNGGQRSLYLAFGLYESDFPLRAAFPIFMTNALNELGAASAAGGGSPIPAGQSVDMTAPAGTEKLTIAKPTGGTAQQSLNGRNFSLTETSAPGVYRIAYAGADGKALGEQLVPVSLVSDSESNISPAKSLHVQGVQEAIAQDGKQKLADIVGSRKVRLNREFYSWIIAAVLLLIAVEWGLYHTRVF
jgi:Ca-activated chloride channel family protein